MKRTVKIVLITAGAVFTLGLVLRLTGLGMGGRQECWRDQDWNVPGISVNADGVHVGGENGIHVSGHGVDVGGTGGAVQGRRTESCELSPFTSLDIDVDLGSILIQSGENYGLSLNWDPREYELAYSCEDEVLKIWGPEDRQAGFGVTDAGAVVTVILPRDAVLDGAEVSTNLGDVTWTADASVGTVELSAALGGVTCRGLTAVKLEAESSLGNISVTLPSELAGVSYDLSADLGEVRLNGQTQNSQAAYIRTDQRYLVTARTSIGDVSLEMK